MHAGDINVDCGSHLHSHQDNSRRNHSGSPP